MLLLICMDLWLLIVIYTGQVCLVFSLVCFMQPAFIDLDILLALLLIIACLTLVYTYLVMPFFGWNWLAPWFFYPVRTTICWRFNLEISLCCFGFLMQCKCWYSLYGYKSNNNSYWIKFDMLAGIKLWSYWWDNRSGYYSHFAQLIGQTLWVVVDIYVCFAS